MKVKKLLGLLASGWVLFAILSFLPLVGLWSDIASADPVGTSYSESDVPDLLWAAQYLGLDDPSDLQKTGVAVINFILNISGRTESECELGYSKILDPYGSRRFESQWTGEELAMLDWVADHYCISREQAQVFGAALLSFFAGLDAGAKGISKVLPVLPESPLVPPVSLSGSGSEVVTFTSGLPSDYQILALTHTGAGPFNVRALDIAGNELEVLVSRQGIFQGRVVAGAPETFAALAIQADGEWTASFQSLSLATRFGPGWNAGGTQDEVLILPGLVQTGAGLVTVRHDGTEEFSIWGYGPDGIVKALPVDQIGAYAGQVELVPGTRFLAVVATGEWTMAVGTDLPPRQIRNSTVERGDGQLHISWSAPEEQSIIPLFYASPVSGYDIWIKPADASDTAENWISVEVLPETTTYTARNLSNGTTYHVVIRAYNSAGAGPWSEPLAMAPLAPGIPDAVSALEATVGDRQVELIWEPPVNESGGFTYQITWYDEDLEISQANRQEFQQNSNKPRHPRRWENSRAIQIGPADPPRLPTIVGGSTASIANYPHTVALLNATVAEGFAAQYCGGTLIAPRWVATAAHCVDAYVASELEVAAGITNLDEITSSERVGVGSIYVSPDYDAELVLNDIALLHLVREVESPLAYPIPWQSTSLSPVSGTPVSVSGWGSTDVSGENFGVELRNIETSVLAGPGEDVCGSWPDFDAEIELCVGGEAGIGACLGDSGGPVVGELGTTRLVGVTSYGLTGACADTRFPNVATRVSSHTDWINGLVGTPWREVVGLTDPAFIVTGLVNGRTYTFRVAATNAYGVTSGSKFVQVTPAGPPDQPLPPTGVGGPESVTLSWVAPFTAEGHPIIDYVIDYSMDFGETWETFDEPVSLQTSALLQGFENGQTIGYRVAARNDMGSGMFSDAIFVLVGAPDAPANISLGQVGDGQISLSWLTPASDGGSAVIDYVVEISIDAGESWSVFDDGVSSQLGTNVLSLVNGVTHSFRVSTVTAIGSSPYSPIVAGVPGRPEPVSDLSATVSDSKVTLVWIPPIADGGSPIMDYVVESSDDGGTTWIPASSPIFVADDFVSVGYGISVTELSNGTPYQFRVAAVTEIGTSLWAEISAIPVTVPDAPFGLSIIPGSARLTLSWEIPPNGGSAISNVYVEISWDGGVTWTSFRAGAGTTSATVTGLVPGEEYFMRVVLENAVGLGPLSGIVSAIPN